MFVKPRVWSRFSRLHQNSESLIASRATLDDFAFETRLGAVLCRVFQLFSVISEQKIPKRGHAITLKVHSRPDDGDKLSKPPWNPQKTNKSSLQAM